MQTVVETPSYLYPYVPLPPVILKVLYFGGTFLLMILSAIGLALALPRWRAVYPQALFLAAMASALFVGVTEERYSVPLVPLMAFFASFTVSTLCWYRTPRKS